MAADSIGRGIIEVVVDASQLEAGMQKAGAAVEKFERTAVAAAGKAGAALAQAGDGASVATDKLDSATKRYIASIEREIAATSKSRAEFRAWEAQVKKIPESVYGPLVQQLSAAKDAQDAFAKSTNEQAIAQRTAAQAAKELAAAQQAAAQKQATQGAFLNDLREQIALYGKSTDAALQYKAARLGVATEAEPLVARLREAKAAQEALVLAAKAEAQAQKDAAQARSTRGPVAETRVAETRADTSSIDATRAQLLASLTQTRAQLVALGAAEAGAATQAGPLIAKLQETARALDDVAAAEQRVAGQQSFIAGLQRQTSAIGKTRADLLEMEARQLGVATAAAPMIAKLREAEKGILNVGLSARQTNAAMRLLPAQITDIVTSLASGQQPWLVAIQQGGQIKDSFGGIGPAFKVLTGLITPMVLGIAAAGTAVGLLAFGLVKGQKETDEFTKALLLTGNAAGSTVSGLTSMAAAVAQVVGTQGAAAEALAAFAATGRFASGSLAQFAETAVRMERVTGQSVKATVAQFVELGRAPAEASRKLNEQYHYLTAAVYAQIVALEEQGKATEAARLAQETFASVSNSRLPQIAENLGAIERGWKFVTDQIKRAGDALLSVGRVDTAGEQIKKLQGLIDLTQTNRNKSLAPAVADAQIAGYQKQIDALNAGEEASRSFAEAEGARARVQEAGITAEKEVARIRKESLTQTQKMNKELRDYKKFLDDIRVANPSSASLDPKEIARNETNIRERFRDKSKSKGEKPRDTTESLLKFDLDKIKNELEQVTGAYKNAESILEAVRSAGLVSEKDYYTAKVSFIRLGTDASIRALEEENAAIEKQQALLEAKRTKLKGNDLVDNEKKIIEHNKQLADNEAKMAVARASATSQIEVLGIRQQASLAAVARSYAEARIEAQEYLDTITRQQARNLAGLGQGQRARERQSGLDQIGDQYQRRRDQLNQNRQLLELESKWTAEAQEQYAKHLSLINEFTAKAATSYDKYWTDLTKMQSDWSIGANESLNDYRDNAANISVQIGDLFANTFQGMEDALVHFTMTGKLDFKSLADSIVADINRIIIRQQITAPLAELIQGGFQSGGGLGGLLKGGLDAMFGSQTKPQVTQASSQEAFRATERAAQNAAGSLVDMTSATSAVSTVMSALPATAAIPATTSLGALAIAANAAATALAGVATSSGVKGGGDALSSVFSLVAGAFGMPDDVPTRGGRVMGGPVTAGQMYEVNERGPELLNVGGRQLLMMGSQSGNVQPISRSGGNKTYNIAVNVPYGTSRENSNHIAATIVRRLRVADVREN